MKNLFAILVVFLFLSILINAQSIQFTSPVNGQVITGTGLGSSASIVPVNLRYYYQLSNNPDRIAMYIKLFPSPYPDQQSNQGDGIDQWWYLPSGTYTWRIELYETYTQGSSYKVAEQTITFYVKYTLYILNNFGGGIVNVDGQQQNHGYSTFKINGETVQLGAIDQQYNGVNYIWNQSGIFNSTWENRKKNQSQFSPLFGASNRNYNYTVQTDDNGAQIRTAMRKVLKINFQNNFIGVGNGGIVKVNNNQYNSPTVQFDVVELNPITATAIYQEINGIEYSFHHWSDNSTTITRTFYPSDTQTFTAFYSGKPSISNRNLHTGTAYNQPIVLYWNEHPNTYVSKYQIWRKVKHNGVMGNPVLIATVNRGTTTYTDYDYYLTNGYTADLIFYDVRPYYSIEGTTSNQSWIAVYGDGSVVPKSSDSANVKQGNIEYSIANYPNPFNPFTKIAYTVKEAENVNIKVYNLLGQQVAELVNEMQQPGSYTIEFDGSNLSSGTYIYTLRTKNYIESKKMVLLR